jgi:hypothetical protein
MHQRVIVSELDLAQLIKGRILTLAIDGHGPIEVGYESLQPRKALKKQKRKPMAVVKCRFCKQKLNGGPGRSAHERMTHPTQYKKAREEAAKKASATA